MLFESGMEAIKGFSLWLYLKQKEQLASQSA